MLLSITYTILGLLILVIGGEVLLRGAVRLAEYFGLAPAIIGLTVVAAGTSVPELAVSMVAAWKGEMDVSVGNVVGSNILNIALILGLVALFRPLIVAGNTIKLEYPVMLLVTLLFISLSMDSLIGRFDGLLFITCYICFTAYLIRVVGKELTPTESEQLEGEVRELKKVNSSNPWIGLVLTLAGIGLLAFGADLTVLGAVEIGRAVGLSERVIGLTIVSIGTSLPELITSLVSSFRGRNDIAIANIIGSNIFNILGILGLTSLVVEIPVSEAIKQVDSWWMLAATLLIFPIMRIGYDITKKEGAVLLGFYMIYLTQLIYAG